MFVQNQRLESILDNVFSNSIRDTYHINRFNEIEINYGSLESAFVDEYGELVGSYLFEDACDALDLEQKAWGVNQEFSESRAADFSRDLYDGLSHMNQSLYAKQA